MMHNNVINGWEFLGLYPSIFKPSDAPKSGVESATCWWCTCYFDFKFKTLSDAELNNEVNELFKSFDGSIFDPRGDDWDFNGKKVPRIVTPERLAQAQAAYRKYLTDYLNSQKGGQAKLNGLSYSASGQSQDMKTAKWKAMESLKGQLRNAWDSNHLEDDSESNFETPEKFPDCDCQQSTPPSARGKRHRGEGPGGGGLISKGPN